MCEADPVIEFRARAAHDPDGAHLTAILMAYLDTEHAHVFRRLLVRRLGFIASLAILAEAVTRAAPAEVFASALALIGGTCLVGLIVEWRAERRLMRLLDGFKAPVR